MKYKIRFILAYLILISFSSNLYSQNLVPNFSFEIADTCPTSTSELSYSHGWFNPSIFPSTPDYFNSCSPNSGTPQYGWGYQIPRTGDAYIGIYTFIDYIPDVREYAESQLSDSLMPGKQYYVEFYASLNNTTKYAVSNLGVYFSDSVLYWNYSTNIIVTPQVENSYSNILSDTINWMKVSGTFIALGGEKYITIGNFRNDSLTHWIQAYNDSTYYNFSYYLIDDVSVACLNCGVGIEENNKPFFSIFPNPTQDKICLAYYKSNFHGNASIYNLLGEKLISHIELSNEHNEIDISILPSGVYIIEINQGETREIKQIVKM